MSKIAPDKTGAIRLYTATTQSRTQHQLLLYRLIL